MNLSVKIFISLILSVIVGLILGEENLPWLKAMINLKIVFNQPIAFVDRYTIIYSGNDTKIRRVVRLEGTTGDLFHEVLHILIELFCFCIGILRQ